MTITIEGDEQAVNRLLTRLGDTAIAGTLTNILEQLMTATDVISALSLISDQQNKAIDELSAKFADLLANGSIPDDKAEEIGVLLDNLKVGTQKLDDFNPDAPPTP